MNLSKWIHPPADRGARWRKDNLPEKGKIMAVAGLLLVVSLLLGALLSGYRYWSLPLYRPGDIARAAIVIPVDALIEDEEATRLRREEAKANAFPVYRFDPAVQEGRIARLRTAFQQSRIVLGLEAAPAATARKRTLSFASLSPNLRSQLRAAIQALDVTPPVDDLLAFLVRENFNADLETRLVALIRSGYGAMIVPDDRFASGKITNINRLNIVTGKAETVPAGSLSTLAQARKRLGRQVLEDPRLPVAGRTQVARLLEGLVIPNLSFDEPGTKARQEQDASNVDHVLRQLKRGKVVLRQGDEVTADHLIQIEALRKLVPAGSSVKQALGMSLVIALLLFIFLFFIRFVPVEQWGYLRLAGFLVLALAINLLLLKGSWFVCESVSRSFPFPPFNDSSQFFYLLPFAWGAMLVTLLADARCAWLFLIFFGVLAGHFTGSDYTGFFYIVMTSLAGILVMRKVTQRIGIIGAGFKLGLASALLFAILQLMKQAPQDPMNGVFGAALAFLSGPVNVIFLVFTIPLCERLFMVTTEMRLSELGNLNLPLIRELILKAPGTYNHSIAVGTLCEGAAEAIGLNPLFLRIGALYHDIGKTARPGYFVENQQGGNPHDRMDPRESAEILRGHVHEGLSLARRAKLPPSLADLIPQHHGTKLMRYFYEKARKEAGQGGGDVPEEPFRYGGPKPQTKTAAILMLADGIEAAARTLEDHSPKRLRALIEKIAGEAARDRQFAECDITLLEMDRITESFLETLGSYYHGRIVYPEDSSGAQ